MKHLAAVKQDGKKWHDMFCCGFDFLTFNSNLLWSLFDTSGALTT